MAARIPAHRRKRDPLARAILAPRIPPPAQAPVAVLTEAEEDWPSPPVPLPGDQAAALHPTPTRVALLRAIAGDEVYRKISGSWWLRTDAGADRRVTVRVDELWNAGWVEFHPTRVARPVELTDAGRAVLAGAR